MEQEKKMEEMKEEEKCQGRKVMVPCTDTVADVRDIEIPIPGTAKSEDDETCASTSAHQLQRSSTVQEHNQEEKMEEEKCQEEKCQEESVIVPCTDTVADVRDIEISIPGTAKSEDDETCASTSAHQLQASSTVHEDDQEKKMEKIKEEEKCQEESVMVPCTDTDADVKDIEIPIPGTAKSEDNETCASANKKLPNISVQSPKSTTKRCMEGVRCPPRHRLTESEIFDEVTGLPNTRKLVAHLWAEGRLDEQAAVRIITTATEIFRKEENLLKLDEPITICGDVHGQFYDLMRLFIIGGKLKDRNYLFLGDYVDRGYFSAECVLLLWALKICHPTKFFLLRGNHECRNLTENFTFKRECEVKYSELFYKTCMESFDCLPLAAIVNNKYFCVHGGLSPDILDVDDIQKINRFQEPPLEGPFCDLLWADPHPDFNNLDNMFFSPNPVRQCSYYFSCEACCKFLSHNNLQTVIRAHEAQQLGCRTYLTNNTNCTVLMTVFSAPNYIDVYNNKAAILKCENNGINIMRYDHLSHPYWLPNFVDALTWSLPFVGEKAMETLLALLNVCSDDELESNEEEASRREIIRNKIRAVGKMARTYSTLRDEQEIVLRLKGLSPTGKLPLGLLTEGRDSLKKALRNHMTFEEAKSMDEVNERVPNLPEGESPRRRRHSSASLKVWRTPASSEQAQRPRSSPGILSKIVTENISFHDDNPSRMLSLLHLKLSTDDEDDQNDNAKNIGDLQDVNKMPES